MSNKISINLNPLLEELEKNYTEVTTLLHRRKQILSDLKEARDTLDTVLNTSSSLELPKEDSGTHLKVV